MKDGINIYIAMDYFKGEIIDRYINLKTSNIIDDYDYNKLSLDDKKKCIKIDKAGIKGRLKIAEKYFNEERNAKYKKILFEEYTTKFIDEINDVNEIHWMLENYGIRHDFLDYEDDQYKKMMINLCKKYNLKYYYEVIPTELLIEDYNKKYKSNDDRSRYYEDKINKKISEYRK